MRSLRITNTWLALLTCVTILCGCVTKHAAMQYGIEGPPGEAMIWPLPPDPPRIRYVGQIESQYSIGFKDSFWSRLKTSLLGVEPAEVVAVHRPFDCYVDDAGRIYVTDGTRPSIQVFDPGSAEAREILPSGAGALAKPMGIAGDAAGHLYVADPVHRRVVALDPSGTFVRAYGGPQLLLNPVDVAVSPAADYVYVVDSYQHQLLVFDRNGTLIRRVGRTAGDLAAKNDRRQASLSLDNAHRDSEPADLVENRGKEPGAFHFPAFVDVGPDGTVYVSDGMNFRVQAFDEDGDYLRHFGGHGDISGSFARPKDLAVDSEGHIYVVDAAFNNVQIFNDQGALLLAFGAFGGGPGELYVPIGLAIDAQDRIYVADRYNSRIQIFQYLPELATVPPAQLAPVSRENPNR